MGYSRVSIDMSPEFIDVTHHIIGCSGEFSITSVVNKYNYITIL